MLRHIAFATVALAAASPSLAETAQDKYWLSGTAMFSTVDSTLRIDGKTQTGTEVSLERDLGLDRHPVLPVVLGGLRISTHWRAELEYLNLNQSGARTIDKNISIGDTTYDVGASLDSSIKTSTYRVAFGYSFIRNEDAELGASIGAHVTRFKTAFSGSGTINGVTNSFKAETRSLTAPLPTLGLFGSYEISRLFVVNGRIDYFVLKIDSTRGELIDALGTVSVRPLKNLSVGAGYRYVQYNVRSSNNDLTGQLNYQFSGPVLLAELHF